jgi:hypothetical protein
MLDFLRNLFRRNPETEYNIQLWTMMTGEQVRVVDMTDAHLRNTIFYMNKRFGQLTSHIMHNGPSERWPIFESMCQEADRRGLKWYWRNSAPDEYDRRHRDPTFKQHT